jgi:cell division protein FtsZ
MSLLKRLAHGLGRREEAEEAQHAAPAREPSFREPVQHRAPTHEDYAKRAAPRTAPEVGHRPAAGSLDPMGRQPVQRVADDDQLEIPAFLRRQAN